MNRISIGSDNGLLFIRCQAIILINDGLLSIGHLGTNSSLMGFLPHVRCNMMWSPPHIAGFTLITWLCFYQTRSAWSMGQGSNKNHSPINNITPTVTKFCVMWEGQALPHDTKFGNCRDKIVDNRAFLSWSLIHGSSWSRLIKAEPGQSSPGFCVYLQICLTPNKLFNSLHPSPESQTFWGYRWNFHILLI